MPNMNLSNEDDVRAIFQLAGFTIVRLWRLENGYWPRAPEYQEVINTCPWWLVQAKEIGLVQIGRRKRVLAIDWSATPTRVIVTSDDVTKSETGVHAYSIEKALSYLATLRGVCPVEAAANDREFIVRALQREANRVFNKQEKDYPSNVLDAVAANLSAGKNENLTERS